MSRISTEDRGDYDEAVRLVPELVRQETPFEHFLWTEDQDATRAALRLARYWKGRKYLFEERWLRPLNQTAMGALYPDDVALFRRGFFVVLERPSGGIVILVDESKLPCQPGLSKTRLVFYLIYLHQLQARKAMTTVHIISGAARPPVELSPDSWALYRTGLPVKFDRWNSFVVQSCFDAGKEDLIDFLTYQTAQSVTFKSQRKANRIIGDSVHSTLSLLQEQAGVERECLPLCLGGGYHYQFFNEWIRQRLTIEATQVAFPVHALTFCFDTTRSCNPFGCKPVSIFQNTRNNKPPVQEKQTSRDESCSHRQTSFPPSNARLLCRESKPPNSAGRKNSTTFREDPASLSGSLTVLPMLATPMSPRVQTPTPNLKRLELPTRMPPPNAGSLISPALPSNFEPVEAIGTCGDPMQALHWVDYRQSSSGAASS